LSYNAQDVQSGVTGTITSLPFTTAERVAQFQEGVDPYYSAAFVGKWTSLESSQDDEEPSTPVTSPSGPAQGQTTTRPATRQVVLTVSELTLNVGEAVVYPQATAVDRIGFIETDITTLIVRSGEILPAVGTYAITYRVTSNGLTEEVTVNVRVVDTVPPVIRYTGSSTLYVGSEFTPTFETSDNAPGVVRVDLIEQPDLTKAGETRLVAVATDASGNQTRLVVPLVVLPERVEVRNVAVNQATVLLVLDARVLDIDTTVIYTAVATSQPAVNSPEWQQYSSSSFASTQANQFVYVKAQDATGAVLFGTPVPLTHQTSERTPVVTPEVAEPSSDIMWGTIALVGAATIGVAGLVYMQKDWFVRLATRSAHAGRGSKQTSMGLVSAWLFMFGLRRQYNVVFYDGDQIVSEQKVKRGNAAKAPFAATWDQAFDDVQEDLIIHRIK
jgi:hypothetical protein